MKLALFQIFLFFSLSWSSEIKSFEIVTSTERVSALEFSNWPNSEGPDWKKLDFDSRKLLKEAFPQGTLAQLKSNAVLCVLKEHSGKHILIFSSKIFDFRGKQYINVVGQKVILDAWIFLNEIPCSIPYPISLNQDFLTRYLDGSSKKNMTTALLCKTDSAFDVYIQSFEGASFVYCGFFYNPDTHKYAKIYNVTDIKPSNDNAHFEVSFQKYSGKNEDYSKRYVETKVLITPKRKKNELFD